MNIQFQLDCKIIPVETGNLLIPARIVEEVVSLEEKDTQERMTWRSRKIPIVQCEVPDKPAARVVVIRTVMGFSELPFLAIATDGIPHNVVVSHDMLSALPDHQYHDGNCDMVAAHASVGSLICVIPDLPKLESRLVKQLQLDSLQV